MSEAQEITKCLILRGPVKQRTSLWLVLVLVGLYKKYFQIVNTLVQYIKDNILVIKIKSTYICRDCKDLSFYMCTRVPSVLVGQYAHLKHLKKFLCANTL